MLQAAGAPGLHARLQAQPLGMHELGLHHEHEGGVDGRGAAEDDGLEEQPLKTLSLHLKHRSLHLPAGSGATRPLAKALPASVQMILSQMQCYSQKVPMTGGKA